MVEVIGLYSQRFKTAQSQQQKISQGVIQSCNVLAMTTEQLSQYIKEQAIENPVIELDDDPWSGDNLCMDDSVFVYIRGALSKNNCEEDKRVDASRYCRKTIETLCDYLVLQLPANGLSKMEKSAFRYLAQSLNPNGYLELKAEEICSLFGLARERAAWLISLLRKMEPAGIGAENLQDCILIQLERKYPKEELAREIAADYLELLSKNQISVIAGKCGKDIASVKAAVELIRGLDPRPAACFSERNAPYIIPDVSVEKADCGYILKSNTKSQICLNIDEGYRNIINNDSGEAAEYLEDKYRQAYFLKNCIENRHRTLMRVAKEIFEAQKMFFYRGEEYLRPLTLKQIAEKLEMHESTVSRAVRGKYIKCRWGVYEMKYFFSNKLTPEMDTQAQNPIAMIKQLVASEPRESPYSDQKLAELLVERGIVISRRTVAKYRTKTGIRSSAERKQY